MKGTDEIFKQGKLVLFLDIDNTILHSIISTHLPYPLLRLEDIFTFPIQVQEDNINDKLYCISKLRPGAIDFLKLASKFFHIIFCTLGTYDYAEKMRERLNQLVSKRLKDVNYETIDPLIISKEYHERVGSNGEKFYCKSFDNFISKLNLNISRSISVILDDRIDVWDPKDVESNLIKIHPYKVFSFKNVETKNILKQEFTYDHQVDKNDQSLKYVWRILSYIHRRFFEEVKCNNENFPSTEMYIKKLRKRILKGVNIYPQGEIEGLLIKNAILHGANISYEFNENVTHIVIEKKNRKNLDQLYNSVYIVNKKWIKDSLMNMKRQSEIKYTIY